MILRVGRETLDLSLDACIEVNNKLSVQYKTEASPERRREIVGILYQINLPLFKKWKIYDFSQKEDYSQEAFFFVSRALEKYDPARGAFLHYLKKYYVKESQRQFLQQQSKQYQIENAQWGQATTLGVHRNSNRINHPLEETGEANPEYKSPVTVLLRNTPEDDALFWQEVRQLLGDDAWEIVKACIFGGLTPTDVARKRGQPIRTINHKYNQALNILRTHIAGRSMSPKGVPDSLGEGEWMGSKKFCRILDITPDYFKNWINPNRPASVCPSYLDPRDVLPAQGVRVRYLFTARDGLVFPRRIWKEKRDA